MKPSNDNRVWEILNDHERRLSALEARLAPGDPLPSDIVDALLAEDPPAREAEAVAAAVLEPLAPLAPEVAIEAPAPTTAPVPDAVAPLQVAEEVKPAEPNEAALAAARTLAMQHKERERVDQKLRILTDMVKTSQAPGATEVPEEIPAPAPMEPAAPVEPPAPPPKPIAPPPKILWREGLDEESIRQQIPPQREPAQRQPTESLEERIGTTWMLRIGGVLIMAGAAWGAVKLESDMSPLLRVIAAYFIAIALGVGASFVNFRNALVGRAGIGIALAIGYFVAFASHYIGRMDIGLQTPPLAVLGMGAHAIAIVYLAERWRSEGVAGFGLCLALIPALMSAQTSDGFALLAVMGLGVTSGFLLLRNGWLRLTSVAVALVYGSIAGLAGIVGLPTSSDGGVYLGALLLQHLIFAAAFVRWSGPSLARERAADEPGAEGISSDLGPGMLPWGRGFDVLNSIGLVASVVFLWWLESRGAQGLLSANLHWALLAMGLLELGRLLTAAGRDSMLIVFHSSMAGLLVVAAAVWGLDGANESIALALLSAMLAIGSAQAFPLRWLRVVAAIPASLALRDGAQEFLQTGTVGASSLVTAFLLFVTTLPLSRWFRTAPRSRVLAALGEFADHYRAFLSALLAITVLATTYSGSTRLMLLLSIFGGLIAGMKMLRITTWREAAVVTSVAVMCVLMPFGTSAQYFLSAIAFAGLIVGWMHSRSQAETGPGHRGVALCFTFLSALGLALLQVFIAFSMRVEVIVQIAIPAAFLLAMHPIAAPVWRRLGNLPQTEPMALLACAFVFLPLVLDAFRETNPIPTILVTLVLAALSLVGSKYNSWRLGVTGAMLLSLFLALSLVAKLSLPAAVFVSILCIALLFFWDRVIRTLWDDAIAAGWPIPAFAACGAWTLTADQIGTDWSSLIVFGFGLLAFATNWWIDSERTRHELGATLTASVGSLLPALTIALFVDARTNAIPGLLFGAIAGALWIASIRRQCFSDEAKLLPNLIMLAMIVGSLLNYGGVVPWVLFVASAVIMLSYVAACRLDRKGEISVAIVGLVAALAVIGLKHLHHPSQASAVVGLMVSGGALVLSRRAIGGACVPDGLARFQLSTGAIIVALVAMSYGNHLPSDIITGVWGLVAAGLVVAGFIWRCHHWRHAGIGTFALAVLRLINIDMSDSSNNARILGCLVVGILMVCSAYLYGYLARTYLPAPEESNPEQ